MTYVLRAAIFVSIALVAPAVLACDPATLDESMVKCFLPQWTELDLWRERLDRYAEVGAQHRLKGLASYYSAFFDGRITANGEIFRNGRLSAAHLTLPFGTWVEIRSRATGRKIRLRVNDRGPYVKKFAIDLSRAAARALGVDITAIATSKSASWRFPATNRCPTNITADWMKASAHRSRCDNPAPSMPLSPGTRVGVYEIVGPIGSGGMGEVYRARDPRLERDVAIKVLPESSSRDRNAIARLQLEARTASALNHPHILTIYDIGAIDSHPPRDYIAMEFIEGTTLRERLAHSAGFDEVGDSLIQVAEGLAKAHEANIVHRDLKPENIMITADGYAKILDFGLAKLSVAGDDDTGAATAAASQPGGVVGTIGYMAPEQVQGLAVDARSDIFSFGCILYEAAAGRRAFTGATTLETLHHIVFDEPPPLRTNERKIAPELQRIISRCLAKDPARRYPAMRELLDDLRRFRRRGTEPAARALPRLTQLTFDRAVEQFPAISPDGTRVVFSREIGKVRNLILTSIDGGGEEPITTGPMDDIQPAWSPDGGSLLFVRARESESRIEPSDVFGRYVGGDIWRLDLATRKATQLITDAANPSFSPDGHRIAFDASRNGPWRIWIADERGRNPEQLTTDTTDAVHHVRPRWSPDARHVVFQNLEGPKFDLRVVDVETKRMRHVTDDYTMDVNPTWSPDGEWIYFSSYRSGGINVWRVPVDSEGAPLGPMEQVTAGPGHDVDVDVGHRVVLAILKQNADLWRLPVNPRTGESIGPPEPVVATTRENSRGAWSPDGQLIAFSSDRGGEMNLWLLSVNDGKTRPLTHGPGGDFQPNWSPDGRAIAFFSGRGGNLDVWRFDLDASEPVRLTDGVGININPFFSPDGKRIAFMSDRDGRLEVWMMTADGTDVYQLTTVGVIGHFLRWSHDGSRIFFRCPTGAKPRTMTVTAAGGDPESIAEIVGGAHMSFSPDQSLIMDVVAHRTLWVSPLNGDPPRRVFEFDDPESRIDYPVWSPDGQWVMFDRFAPKGGNIWMVG
jgi:Tol biopolymer transport system component